MKTGIDLCILIVTYNSAGVIGSCLQAIDREWHPHVLIVDNNSTDNTVAIARALGITVLSLEKNIGFGQAANRGARASNASVLCFLNPDCIPETELFVMGFLAVRQNRLACAVPNTIDDHGTRIQGRQPGYSGLKLFSDMICTNYGCFGICRFLGRLPGFHNYLWFWPHGACFFMDKLTFLRMGGFSSRYFLYMEDVVLGCELHRAGGQVVELDCRLVHHEGKGSDIRTGDRRRLLNRARYLYALDHHGFCLALLLTAIGLPAKIAEWVTGSTG